MSYVSVSSELVDPLGKAPRSSASFFGLSGGFPGILGSILSFLL